MLNQEARNFKKTPLRALREKNYVVLVLPPGVDLAQ
jgi:hypothetical protein